MAQFHCKSASTS